MYMTKLKSMYKIYNKQWIDTESNELEKTNLRNLKRNLQYK